MSRDLTENVAVAAPAGPLGALSSSVHMVKLNDVGDPSPQVWSMILDSVVVATVRAGAYEIVAEEASRNTFFFPLRGQVEMAVRGATLAFGRGGSALIRPGLRRSRLWPEGGSHFIGIGVSGPALQTDSKRPPSSGAVFEGRKDIPAVCALRNYLVYLAHHMGRTDSPMLQPAARSSAAALVFDLMFEADGFDGVPTDPEVSKAEQRVARAEAFMRAHADEPLTILRIARMAGVGPRALQVAFRQRHGASPRAMLQRIRLERAHCRLMSPEFPTSVTEVALQSGFAHLGRFAAAYRARFGESPLATLSRARVLGGSVQGGFDPFEQIGRETEAV